MPKHQSHEMKEEVFWRRYLVSQFALVVVSIAVGIVAFCNLKTLQDTLKQTERAVRAANAQASAAVVQASVAKQSMQVGLRPYVALGLSKDRQCAEWVLDNTNNKVGVKVYFENAGNTPAERFIVNGHAKVGGESPPKCELSFLPGPTASLAQGIDFGHRISAHQTIPITLPGVGSEDIKTINRTFSGQPLAYYGCFAYTNVFGDYCCDPFQISLDSDGNSLVREVSDIERRQVCPPIQKVNICEPPNPRDRTATN